MIARRLSPEEIKDVAVYAKDLGFRKISVSNTYFNYEKIVVLGQLYVSVIYDDGDVFIRSQGVSSSMSFKDIDTFKEALTEAKRIVQKCLPKTRKMSSRKPSTRMSSRRRESD
jgi:hypothetical protein